MTPNISCSATELMESGVSVFESKRMCSNPDQFLTPTQRRMLPRILCSNTLAGETACKVATDAEIATISDINSRLLSLPESMEDLEFFRLDMEFHGAIVRAAHNLPLDQTHRQYNAKLWRARFMSSRQIDRRGNTLAEHCTVVEALSARDSRKSAIALRNHLKSTIRNISRLHGNSVSAESG